MAAGWSALHSGKPQAAAAFFTATIIADPTVALSHYGLALARRELGRDDQAMSALDHALQLDPGFASAHILMGMILAKRGDRLDAERAFETAITHDPSSVQARIQLSSLLAGTPQWEKAIEHARRATELAPADAHVQVHFGHLLATAGQVEPARAAFEAAIAIDQAQPAARAGLANLLAKQGNVDEAVAQARTAAQLAPDASRIQSTLGYLLLLQGDATAARDAYAAAARLEPSYGAAYHGWATAVEQTGDPAEALRVIEEGARMAPGDGQLSEKRDALLARLNNSAGVTFRGITALTPSIAARHATPIYDTYSYLLDHPEYQSFSNLLKKIEYSSHEFSKQTYEQSRGTVFATDQDAYRDWVVSGRREGLAYFPGKNTLLKIVLKVKDEPELIVKWIEYHAEIVGYHNIIIMDCGSTNPRYLEILDRYQGKMLILRYEKYYDTIHNPEINIDFYQVLSDNCKYITVIDADEFLFGCYNNTISSQNVLNILSHGDESIYAGTWFANTTPPKNVGRIIDWTQPIRCSLEHQDLVSGTIGGKAVMKSATALTVKHVGHNLHLPDVIARLNPSSFGKIGIIHLSRLGLQISQSRVVKHLYARQALPADLPSDRIADFLREKLQSGEYQPLVAHYAKIYLGLYPEPAAAGQYFDTHILFKKEPEQNVAYFNVMKDFDFEKVVETANRDLAARG